MVLKPQYLMHICVSIYRKLRLICRRLNLYNFIGLNYYLKELIHNLNKNNTNAMQCFSTAGQLM